MINLILMSVVYMGVMYFATRWIYRRKNIEITRPELIVRTVFSGVVFFVLMYVLGLM